MLRITIGQVERQGRTLKNTFRLLKALSLLPVTGALLVVVVKYWDALLCALIATVSLVFTAINVDTAFWALC
ncbi:hypothetical protein D3C78_1794370 [compost metagenome]